MTPALLFARVLIIHCVTLWLAPVEYAFDMIESELVSLHSDFGAIAKFW
jgi:hypothetical protein